MVDQTMELNDVVIGSRIHLARNIAEFPFVETCSDAQRFAIESTVRAGFTDDVHLSQLSIVNSFELELIEQQFLFELESLSVRQAQAKPSDETVVMQATKIGDLEKRETFGFQDQDQHVAVTINEEDHLLMSVTRGDFGLEAAWEQISDLDDRVEDRINYAFSPRWGYLTASPANVGTGMRVSVIVHLPALVLTAQIEKTFRSLKRVNVNAQGMFGESNTGDFFRVSNQATLGRDEAELIEQIGGVVPLLVKYERQARDFLLTENREGLRRISVGAVERLCSMDVRYINDEMLSHLSRVRLGVALGLLDQEDASRVDSLFAVVNLRRKLQVAIEQEDYRLASVLRDRIAELERRQRDDWGTR